MLVYSMKGQIVYRIQENSIMPGYYSVDISQKISKGNYVIKFISGKYRTTRKVSIVK